MERNSQSWVSMTARLFFALSLICALPTLAQNSTPSQASKQACLICDWKINPEIAAQASNTDACEDLFPAACLNESGEYKSKALFEKVEAKLKNIVLEARNKGAQEMGYPTLEQALTENLKKNGYALKTNISEGAKKYILENDYSSYAGEEEIFESKYQCNLEAKRMQQDDLYKIEDISTLREKYNQYLGFETKRKEEGIKNYAKNLPQFLSKLSDKCKDFDKKKAQIAEKNLNDQLVFKNIQSMCSEKRLIRDQVVKIYLKKSSPETVAASESLVRKYFDLAHAELYSLEDANKKYLNEKLPDEILNDLSGLRSAAMGKFYSLTSACSLAGDLQKPAGNIVTEISDVVNDSRVALEHVIDQIYTIEKYQKAMEIFNLTKKEVFKVAQKITQDPAKLRAISAHFETLGLTWITKKHLTSFKKDPKTGVELVDFNNTTPGEIPVMILKGLSMIDTLNAFYTPDARYGVISDHASVTMLPYFIELLDDNSFSYTSVVAHEIAHALGPRLSRINGFDLRNEHEQTLACLSSSDSAQMEEIQSDESTSDFISAEVLASLISKLPLEKRKGAVFSALQDFCMFSAERDQNLGVSLKDSHPEPFLRISAILGGNKSLRQTLSCNQDSKTFRTCSLPGRAP